MVTGWLVLCYVSIISMSYLLRMVIVTVKVKVMVKVVIRVTIREVKNCVYVLSIQRKFQSCPCHVLSQSCPHYVQVMSISRPGIVMSESCHVGWQKIMKNLLKNWLTLSCPNQVHVRSMSCPTVKNSK